MIKLTERKRNTRLVKIFRDHEPDESSDRIARGKVGDTVKSFDEET